jgi:hypothetical protein
VRMEPLEGMLFLTDSGSIRSAQQDLHRLPDIANKEPFATQPITTRK